MAAGRLLILEDDVSIATMLTTILSFECYDVAVADSPDQAGIVARQFRPQVILVGCHDRGRFTPGWQAATLLANLLPDVPLIMLSTSEAAVGEVGVTERGRLFSGVLLKPFRIEALFDLLADLCSQNRKVITTEADRHEGMVLSQSG